MISVARIMRPLLRSSTCKLEVGSLMRKTPSKNKTTNVEHGPGARTAPLATLALFLTSATP
jgi:hypothetical protein